MSTFRKLRYDQPELLSDDALLDTLIFCEMQMKNSLKRAENATCADERIDWSIVAGVDSRDYHRVLAEFNRRIA